jgi:hypothetical protein
MSNELNVEEKLAVIFCDAIPGLTIIPSLPHSFLYRSGKMITIPQLSLGLVDLERNLVDFVPLLKQYYESLLEACDEYQYTKPPPLMILRFVGVDALIGLIIPGVPK